MKEKKPLFPISVYVVPGWEIKKWDYPGNLVRAQPRQLTPPGGPATMGSHGAHLRSHIGSDPHGPSSVWREEGWGSAGRTVRWNLQLLFSCSVGFMTRGCLPLLYAQTHLCPGRALKAWGAAQEHLRQSLPLVRGCAVISGGGLCFKGGGTGGALVILNFFFWGLNCRG